MTVLTRDEFALLLSKVAPFYQPLVLTLVATGLRFGEATALTASDVDVSVRPATIRVTKAWKRDEDSRYYVGPPKTKRARRTISPDTRSSRPFRYVPSGASETCRKRAARWPW